mmetsp:Transcript_48721/g.130414  ORF Transcript_48721/g.130414 Transcript_48721/m.130414 type:complete len:276 (-) Transcript_48721:56-883(-)
MHYVLALAALRADPQLVAFWAVRGRLLRLHGRGLGWLHFRPEHDRRACVDACGPRPLQLWCPPRLHALLRHRHRHGSPDPRGWLAAVPLDGAAGPTRRLLGLPGPRVLRHRETLARRDEGRLLDNWLCPLPHPSDHGAHGRGCRLRLLALPDGVLRSAVVTHPRPLYEAYQDRQPLGGLGCRAPARKRRDVRELPQLAPRLCAAGRPRQPRQAEQRLLLHGPLRIHRPALLGEDVALGFDLRPHHLHRLCDLVWIPPRHGFGAFPPVAWQEAWLR